MFETHQLNGKRMRKPKFEALKEALQMWFATMQVKKAIISDAILLEKGKEFVARLKREEFMASSGWLSHFKARHRISQKVLHGDSVSVDAISVSTARSALKKVTSAYALRDIYNMDETGLFYRKPPNKH